MLELNIMQSVLNVLKTNTTHLHFLGGFNRFSTHCLWLLRSQSESLSSGLGARGDLSPVETVEGVVSHRLHPGLLLEEQDDVRATALEEAQLLSLPQGHAH